ncbi:MAG: hypothetical protein JSU85_10575 [Candidatus Zixiibacteriota bacterium]|nr:MAG: hypothetical protein JSU85_10575 [candidate division Zixibacteria bacterium]
MNQGEIKERLEKIKSDIENAFSIELIDFDEIERKLSSVIDAIQDLNRTAISEDKIVLNIVNYI